MPKLVVERPTDENVLQELEPCKRARKARHRLIDYQFDPCWLPARLCVIETAALPPVILSAADALRLTAANRCRIGKDDCA
jgi:hypothetical protein